MSLTAADRRRRAEWLKAKRYAEGKVERRMMSRLVRALVLAMLALLVTSIAVPFMVMESETIVAILGTMIVLSLAGVIFFLTWAFYLWRRLGSLRKSMEE